MGVRVACAFGRTACCDRGTKQTLSVILTTPTDLSAPEHRPVAPPATPRRTAARLTDRQTSRSSRTRLFRLQRRLPAYQGQEGRWRRIRQLGVSRVFASDLGSDVRKRMGKPTSRYTAADHAWES